MKKSWPVFVLILSILTVTGAYADGGSEEDLKRLLGKAPDSVTQGNASPDETVIRITPDTTKIVRLDEDAASVVVTNPAHAAVILDSPRLLVVMPRQPGVTSFTVLNGKGETIMERTVIVASSAKPDYVRIRRACGADPACVPYAYFYCPDGCYEVSPVGAAAGAEVPPVISNSGATAGTQPPSAQPLEAGSGPVITTVPGPTLLPGEQ